MKRLAGFLAVALARFALAEESAFGVRDFGARGDGRTLDTGAIQKAVDAAAAEGGVVLFPEGVFLTGTIVLRSGVTLRLEEKATILGTKDLTRYRAAEGAANPYKARWERGLIYGRGVENVTIEGQGTIDGNGIRDPGGEAGQRGPHTISMRGARNVTVRGIRVGAFGEP